jgi:phospholipid-translocating ATPase
MFGAAAPQVAMLPLLFILTVTAIKDGVEDYRRATLDEEVNTSASTKLGGWRNVNQPEDPREWWEKLFGLNKPGTVSRGVRKLRQKEAMEGRIVLTKNIANSDSSKETASLEDRQQKYARARSLEDIQSINSSEAHEYPPIPATLVDSQPSLTGNYSSSVFVSEQGQRLRANSMASISPSQRSRASMGVVDWSRRTQGTAHWERTLWKKLEIGDFVLLRENDQIPADIIVLSTSDADGLCYVETKNLDGETNLKPRKSLKATSSLQSEEDIEHARFLIDSEPPHANLYLYNGVLKYRSALPTPGDDSPAGPEEDRFEAITINSLLLRGCTVRNTNWIIGLVVFTGADTKIMLNGGDTPSKRSKIEKETNFNVVMNFLILMVMCITTAIVSGYYESLSNTSSDSYEIGSQPTSSIVLNSLITFAYVILSLIFFTRIIDVRTGPAS